MSNVNKLHGVSTRFLRRKLWHWAPSCIENRWKGLMDGKRGVSRLNFVPRYREHANALLDENTIYKRNRRCRLTWLRRIMLHRAFTNTVRTPAWLDGYKWTTEWQRGTRLTLWIRRQPEFNPSGLRDRTGRANNSNNNIASVFACHVTACID